MNEELTMCYAISAKPQPIAIYIEDNEDNSSDKRCYLNCEYVLHLFIDLKGFIYAIVSYTSSGLVYR